MAVRVDREHQDRLRDEEQRHEDCDLHGAALRQGLDPVAEARRELQRDDRDEDEDGPHEGDEVERVSGARVRDRLLALLGREGVSGGRGGWGGRGKGRGRLGRGSRRRLRGERRREEHSGDQACQDARASQSV